MLDLLIVAIFILFDFFISLWDAYASGVNKGVIEKNAFTGIFTKIVVYAGLGIAFAGMTYVLIIILSFYLILYRLYRSKCYNLRALI